MTPLRVKYFATVFARFMDNALLSKLLPVLSVCPSIRIFSCGFSTRMAMSFSNLAKAAAFRLSSPIAKKINVLEKLLD